MKTRIKVIEYNDGRKEYVCQKDIRFPLKEYFNSKDTLIPVIILSPLLFLVTLIPNWETFTKKEGAPIVIYSYAIFPDLESAKTFIANELNKHKEAELIKWNAKIKKTKIIK